MSTTTVREVPPCAACARQSCAAGGESRRLLGLFDSLGPVMSGPSSSHTAGMARMGRMGHILLGGSPERVDLHFYGALSHTYKGHASDAALVAGLMGEAQDSARIRQALRMAEEAGISVTVHPHPEDTTRNPNTARMLLTRGGRTYEVTGISVGGGEIKMTEFEGFSVSLRGYDDGALLLAGRDITRAEAEALLGPLESFQLLHAGERRLAVCLCAGAAAEALPNSHNAPSSQGAQALEIFALRNIIGSRLADATPLFDSLQGLAQYATADGVGLAKAAEAYEMRRSGVSCEVVRQTAGHCWDVMLHSMREGLTGDNDLVAGFVARDSGQRLAAHVQAGKSLSGSVVGLSVARALAVMERNGSMHCVVAAPTAGACGVLPGALLSVAEARAVSREHILDALLVAAAVGVIIAMRLPISGAMGGCQSEIGVASGMTAAALAHVGGGSPQQVMQAVAMALKNMLGLACDPVAGPVEIPCIKRNAVGVANAFAAADMALAGVESSIPPDEVVDALIDVQHKLPPDLRGNLQGSLAATKTGRHLKDVWYQRMLDMQKK